MPYTVNLKKVKYEVNKYLFNGKTTCVALVQQTTGAPSTSAWTAGIKVKDAKPGVILPGTAIATFDALNNYPTTDLNGRHAALYVSHDAIGIKVIDQWDSKPTPSQRTIMYRGMALSGWQNNGDYFYVVEKK